jgi:hypothetical protein
MLSASEHPALELDAYKLAHHGSRANTSKKLLERLACRRYLISTNGSQFEHPDRESIARIIQFGSEEKDILFNYETDYTTIRHNDSLENFHKYQARFESKLSL